MKYATLKVWLLSVLLATLTSAAMAAEDETPSGTIVIDETQVMLLIGGDAGEGTLVMHSNGDVHKFKVKGVKLGGIGIQTKHMTGEVYNLDDIKDFAGTYFTAEAGIAVVKGAGGSWMKNSKGVVMHLKSAAEGVALSVGVEGLEVELED